ncbi:MAG: hypothetical protein NVSMB9_12610 [Isosphaeraceae bacterium]
MTRHCPGCRAVVKTGDHIAGQPISCPTCGRSLVAGSQTDSSPSPTECYENPGSEDELTGKDEVPDLASSNEKSDSISGVQSDSRFEERTTRRLLENRRTERIGRGILPPGPDELIGDDGVVPPTARRNEGAAVPLDVRGEPWYYRLLTLYTSWLMTIVLLALIVLVLGSGLIANEILRWLSGKGWLLGFPLFAVSTGLAVVLLGLLFNAAIILLFVDAARNLREINLRLARMDEGQPSPPRRTVSSKHEIA